jgi:hypothetical protein
MNKAIKMTLNESKDDSVQQMSPKEIKKHSYTNDILLKKDKL